MQLQPGQGLISEANKAFRAGQLSAAMAGYVNALLQMPKLGTTIAANIALVRQKYLVRRTFGDLPQVIVCGWDLGHNAAGRANTLAEIYREFTDVAIVGSIFARSSSEIWEPMRDSSVPIYSFAVRPDSFFAQALAMVAGHPADLVHLSKPRAPNILFGIFYKLLWGAQVILDIDDEELTFVNAGSSLTVSEFLKHQQTLPLLDQINHKEWTRLAVVMAREFDAITVSNIALQQRYGGDIIGHARDPHILNPSTLLRTTSREKYGIHPTQKVVLFSGTPRRHKGLLEVAKAIQSLKRKDILYVIAGSFTDHLFKATLQGMTGVNYLFLENQPLSLLPRVLAIADCCVLLQDTNHPITAFQIPAKLSDALAMRVPVICSATPALEHVISAGAVIITTAENLAIQLAQTLDSNNIALIDAGQSYFNENFTLAANALRLRKILSTTPNNSLSTNLNQLMNGIAVSESIKNALHTLTIPRKLRAQRQHLAQKIDEDPISKLAISVHVSNTEIWKDRESNGQIGLLNLQNNQPCTPHLQIIETEALASYRRSKSLHASQDSGHSPPNIDWATERKKHRQPDLVSIIIPIYNQPELTATCVASLYQHTSAERFELILVDNGSDTPTQILLHNLSRQHSNLRLLRNAENLNFATGCNQGFATCKGERVVFLNNDTTVTPNWLTPLLDALRRPGISVVQPKLLYPDGKIQCIGVVFSNKSPLGYPIYAGMTPEAPWAFHSRKMQAVTGACMVLRSSDFAALDGFDPIYINGQEDIDLCLRLNKLNGKPCGWVATESTVIHYEGKTSHRYKHVKNNRSNYVRRWQYQVIPDDFKYYAEDGFVVKNYQTLSDSTLPTSLQIYRPNLISFKSH